MGFGGLLVELHGQLDARFRMFVAQLQAQSLALYRSRTLGRAALPRYVHFAQVHPEPLHNTTGR